MKNAVLSCCQALLMLGMTAAYGQQEDISKILWTANWSADSRYVAVGGVDKKIRIFSGQSFELLQVIDNHTEIQRMSWHPFSNTLAVAALGDGSKIIDIEGDSIIYLKGAQAHGTRAMAWNSSGDLLANADYEGEITIWSQHGEYIRTIKKENTISNLAIDWHPAKNEFIVLSDEWVRMYNAEGTLLKKFRHRKEKVVMLCVQWHNSGNFFVIGDYGDRDMGYKPLLQYWKSNGEIQKTIDISQAEYRNMAWTQRGDKLATASDALRIWTKKGKLKAQGYSADNLWGVDWSPDGQFIVTSSHNGHITLWDKRANLIKRIVM